MIKTAVKVLLILFILTAVKLPAVYFEKSDAEYLEEKFAKEDFDTVFIGSSRTKFAIIPAYFDKLSRENTRSFNFGIAAGSGDESLIRAKQLLENYPKLKRIYIELSIFDENRVNFMEEPWKDLTVSRYWLRARKMSFSELAGFHDQLFVRLLKPEIRGNRPDFNSENYQSGKGSELAKPVPVSESTLRRAASFNAGAETNGAKNEQVTGWKQVSDLIANARGKEIEIRFFITPRLRSAEEKETVSAIYQNLKEKNRLKSAHADPIFYRQDTSIDSIHVNRSGAMKFTESLASEFNDR
ncbi:MAG: hypothetical protein R2681_07345 [Pyrinomonadaceae bacterium]